MRESFYGYGLRADFVNDSGFPHTILRVVLRKEDVDRRQYEQREDRPDRHAADENQTDGITSRSTGAAYQRQREMAGNRRDAGHEHRPQPRERRFAHGINLRFAFFLKLVRKLDDQDAVLRD